MKGIERIFFFLISPILSVPVTLRGVYFKSFSSLILVALTLGLLSYLYIPTISNDKVNYIELYNLCEKYGFDYLIGYLKNGRPDFILHFLVYLFAYFGLSFSWLFFCVTSFTTGVCFYIFNKVGEKLSSAEYFFGFLLVLFSFSLPDLFSGLRFYFASSFVFLGVYFGLLAKKKFSVLYFIVAGLIHFSTFLFLGFYIILRLSTKSSRFYRNIFLSSLIFLLIPKSLVLPLFTNLGLDGVFEDKANIYLGETDFIESGISGGSSNYIVVYLMSISWSFFAYLYLLFKKHQESIILNVVYLFFAGINVFYSITTVYSRYLLVVKFLFIILFIFEQSKEKNRWLQSLFLVSLIINIISNIIVMRYNIIESFFNLDILLLLSIVFKNMSNESFIK